MSSEPIIAGLDIGSSTIRIVVGQISRAGEGEQLNVIGVVEVPAVGINRGSVVSLEDAVTSISACLEKAERMIGMQIGSVWVGMGGTHINSQDSNGVIAISRTNGEIQEADVERVIDAARAVAAPVNYEILHVLPKTFSIDNQTGVKDPIGMSGIRLEVNTQVIRALSSHVGNLKKSIHRTGLDIRDLVFGTLAASEAVLSSRQKELGVALVDIGASTTKLVVFEEDDIVHTAVLPVGADHVTSDLAICLQTSLDIAERVKLELGTALVDKYDKNDEVNLRDFGGEDQVFSKRFIAEIIESRVEEIFEKINKELQKIGRNGLLPAGIILVGGGAKLSGMVEVGKRKTLLPVALGVPKKFNAAVDKVNDISYSVALGLVMLGFGAPGRRGFGWRTKLPSMGEAAGKVKSWLEKLFA